MKNLIILAALASSAFSNASFSQVSFATFGSLSYEKKGTDFKNRIGGGFNLSYNVSENVAVGFQYKHKEMCSVASQDNAVVPFNSKSIEVFFHQMPRKETKWSLMPRAGITVGFGNTIKDKNQDQNLTQRKKDLSLLDHPYFCGVIIEIGAGVRLSPKLLLSGYLKNEGLVGVITNRSVMYENGTSFGSVSFGIRMYYIFHSEKNPYHAFVPIGISFFISSSLPKPHQG
jgi:hypothetical protein